MGIRVRKVDNSFGIWDSFNCEFVNPKYLGITKEAIEKYAENNPYPEEKAEDGYLYSKVDMINDITTSEGSLIIPGTEAQAEWIADMLQALL